MRTLSMALVLSVLTSCSFGWGRPDDAADDPIDEPIDDPDQPRRRRPELTCIADDAQWEQVQRLYDDTEHSVHELITCGGLQMQVTRQLMIMIVSSNEEFLREQDREELGDILRQPFTQQEDGRWSMPIPNRAASTFSLEFYDPGSGAMIHENLFELENYLIGARVRGTLNFEEMSADPDRKNSLTFEWRSPGPLAYLLNAGQPLPDGFELSLSLNDLLGGGPLQFYGIQPSVPVDYGVLGSLRDVDMESLVELRDPRGETQVDYRVRASRSPMSRIAAQSRLNFDVEALQASRAELVLSADVDTLELVTAGLAGEIRYEISGTLAREPLHVRVTSDFGTGASYPVERWSCAP